MIELILHIDRVVDRLHSKYSLFSLDRYRRIVDRFIRFYYETSYLFFRSKRKVDSSVVVSLTTIPSRIDNVWLTIESIYRQTVQPERVILYIAEDEFSSGDIPRSLIREVKRGLSIVRCENLLSHKKYYYSLKEWKDKLVITIDDDIIYSEKMIERLMREYRKNPGAIVCCRANVIKRLNDRVLKYDRWNPIDTIEKRNIRGRDIFFTTGGGTVFPASLMPKETFDKKVFMQLSRTADDVWLNYMARLASIPVKWSGTIDCNCHFYWKSQRDCLSDVNLGDGENDKCIKRLYEYYKIAL